ncbi:6(G)-fructosyltransferase-like isoform X2 [Phalaenopsis equestris]|uniref:6(G)-fructosyltransferase-like isoform X2 n=1 Tax=Phalaenopsis equestris TaxID=78828 RepID=UPI0009E552CE|nr:6(G)-fructosyltransferase-like isoform X2 [Phalaenopsis equestris]
MAETASYALLPTTNAAAASAVNTAFRLRPVGLLSLALATILIIGLAIIHNGAGDDHSPGNHQLPMSPELDGEKLAPHETPFDPVSRGLLLGVSEKSSGVGVGVGVGAGLLTGDRTSYPWTNDMLQWQRTGFHFQPLRNWMNGPVFYKGWYHLFYQYNSGGAVWGNITWGHAASRDLLNWLHLPVAIVADHWYDTNGVWTGSATVLPDGNLIMLYTGSTNSTTQVQCLALPTNPSDPLLIHWHKHEANPVLLPPPSILPHDFRDPSTAWADPSDSSTFLLAIGSKDDSRSRHAGVAYVYATTDFVSYRILPGVLHAVEGTGMWECIDFFPVSVDGQAGLDTSEKAGAGIKHVLKVSVDDDRHDYYAIGTYDAEGNKWVVDDAEKDVGVGLRYDWGKFYAAKTFYDPHKKRRVLWGWVGETDSEQADLSKGWASIMSIPRTILFDSKTRSNLLFWPVEEVNILRTRSFELPAIDVLPGSVVPLNVPAKAAQIDIEAEFEVQKMAEMTAVEADVGYNCSTSDGAAGRGLLGPFGLLVLADKDVGEQTATYFYLAASADGADRNTHFCQDETRSSRASDLVKRVVGSTVPVLEGERLTVRILVDHSIVESFAQGGRSAITSRVYPTKSFHSARVFLFNNATRASVRVKSIKIWEMKSTFNHIYEEKSYQFQ